MRVHCPQCGRSLTSDGIDIGNMSARCSTCDVVVGLGELLDRDDARTREAKATDIDEELPTAPKRIRRCGKGAELEILFRWYLPIFWYFLAFGIGWNVITVRILSDAAAEGTLPVSLVLTSLHSVAGVFVVVFAILGLVNRTTVRIEGGVVTVRVGPLRVRRAVRVDVREIHQLFRRKKEGTFKSLFGGFELIAIRADNPPLCIIDWFADADELRYIERSIERHLGIPDRRVEGEYVADIRQGGPDQE